MKIYTLNLIFSLLSLTCFSQTKYFMDADNNFTDSLKATSYMLVFEKIDNDTVYRIKQFSLQGKLLVSGSFKDQELGILHGNFEYYKLRDQEKKSTIIVKGKSNDNEINYYLETKGAYIDGKKSGVWIDYYPEGNVFVENTYESDLLNGKSKRYTRNGDIYLEGNYVNDQKDGDWSIYNGSTIDTYKLGKLIKSKKYKDNDLIKAYKEGNKYNIEARPPGDFNFNLRKFMATIGYDEVGRETAKVTFQIDEKGKISNPDVSGINDMSLKQKITEYFLSTPNWVPATRGKEKTPTKSTFIYTLNFQ